jgi:hypothetical protein
MADRRWLSSEDMGGLLDSFYSVTQDSNTNSVFAWGCQSQ